MTTAGHCLCRKTGWEFEGEASWGCYCHCDDCRRNCAAPVVAWVGVPLENFKWRGATPQAFESSPGVRRYFAAHVDRHLVSKPAIIPAPCMSMPPLLPTRQHLHLNFTSITKAGFPGLKMDDDLPKHEGTLFQTSDEAGQGD